MFSDPGPSGDRLDAQACVTDFRGQVEGYLQQLFGASGASAPRPAPVLAPKLWYGMPAYALGGKVVCFFQSAEKFKARYATLGFSDQAKLDEGTMWAAGFALTEVTAEVEAQVAALVKRAVS